MGEDFVPQLDAGLVAHSKDAAAVIQHEEYSALHIGLVDESVIKAVLQQDHQLLFRQAVVSPGHRPYKGHTAVAQGDQLPVGKCLMEFLHRLQGNTPVFVKFLVRHGFLIDALVGHRPLGFGGIEVKGTDVFRSGLHLFAKGRRQIEELHS